MDPRTRSFHTTRWSLVLRAGNRDSPEQGRALEELCGAYWYPLYAYARRRGRGAEQAEDDVQGFFAHLLAKEALAVADPERGRFRSFLLTSFRNFQAGERERAAAEKRGGGRSALSFEGADAEQRFLLEPTHEETPERLFLRDWAVALLGEVLERLRANYIERDQGPIFDALKETLTAGAGGRPLTAIAAELEMSESAVRVAAHRLRGRFRQAIRDEIAQTVEDPAGIDLELAELFSALGGV